MEEKNIRIGLIGTGTIAGVHANAIAGAPGAHLVASTSRRPGPGRAFCDTHGCAYEPSVEALLARADIDAVAITTASSSHADLGIAAARAGKHVFCEKPIDISLEKVDALIGACDQAGVKLGAVFQSRLGNSGVTLKGAVDQGRFGQLSQCSAYIPWYRTAEYFTSVKGRGTWAHDGGGALMNQGIHAVDMLLWVAGDVAEVSARYDTRLHDVEVEDNVVAWVRFTSGALGVIQSSTCSYPGQPRRLEITGEKGSVILEDDVFRKWDFADERPEDEAIRNPATHSGIGGGFSDPKAIGFEGHRRLYEDFVRSILEGSPLRITGNEARRSVELILAIYHSSREGKTIRLR